MKRKDSLKLAQKRHREKLTEQGAHRLNFFISRQAYEGLKTQAAISGKTLKEQIETLALSENSASSVDIAFERSDGRVELSSLGNLHTMCKDELIKLAIKQDFWLQRMQKVNSVLMDKKNNASQFL